MGFQEFIFRVKVKCDTPETWMWCHNNLEIGHWGKLFGLSGNTATYCFEKEEDALVFKINHGHK